MKGLELSEGFYLEYGAPMLEKEFSELCGIVAVGLCGSESGWCPVTDGQPTIKLSSILVGGKND
jgi:hypothetical protein